MPLSCLGMTLGRSQVILALVINVLVPVAADAQPIGTDITGLNLCLYGDCEARGAYAADPYGWVNPATLPVGTLPYVPFGAFFSASYFKLDADNISADIESGTITMATAPFVLQANAVYAEAEGPLRAVPLDLRLRTWVFRATAAMDLDRAELVPGLSVGAMGAIPITDSDLRISVGDVTLVDAHEDREIDLTLGLHWRGGRRDWFMAGAFVNAIRNPVTTDVLDLATFEPLQTTGTTEAWFARAGVSLLPFVGLGLATGSSPGAEWLREIRLAADIAHARISVPDESTRETDTGYFGLDARVVPDAWSPISRFMRVYAIGGTDTDGGWGAGMGLYGNGPLEFLSCNPAYSSRPIAKSLGNRVNTWSATCSLTLSL